MATGKAPIQVNVRIEEEFQHLLSPEWLEQAARQAVDGEGPQSGSSIDVTITGDATVRELNASHRGKDETTDVLSFSYQGQGAHPGGEPASAGNPAEEFPMPPGETPSLGDVVISYPQARRQAEEAQVPVNEEVAHLVAHGALHLLGYDHDDPARDQAMRAREGVVLATLLPPRSAP